MSNIVDALFTFGRHTYKNGQMGWDVQLPVVEWAVLGLACWVVYIFICYLRGKDIG